MRVTRRYFMKSLMNKISDSLKERGMKVIALKIEHIEEVKDEILNRHSSGMFDEEFFQKNFSWLPSNPKHTINNPKTAIIVAAPQSMTKCNFAHAGKNHEVIIPPTYISTDILHTINDILKKELSALGYSFERVTVPLKLLTVRSGLGQYGRNNICYVPGMGSFVRLNAYYTDLECEGDNWQEPVIMKECENCRACLKSCPSEAIKSDRFLLHGEHCMTAINEYEGDFPDWVDKSWHNSLIGCMSCQLCCPVNKTLISIEDGLNFSEEETELLLNGVPEEQLPDELKMKLQRMCITDYYDVLPRNLRVLI